MNNRLRNWLGAHRYARWIYPALLIAIAALSITTLATDKGHVWLYLTAFMFVLFVFRPSSALHTATVEKNSLGKVLCGIIVAAATVLTCVLPMSKLPLWNGEVPGHRNQYELMAESILDGRIDIVYGDEDALAQLENPYDPDERREAGVSYHWDHAYYEGHYYMYFGVVPVFLVFLPYRILTGTALTTYHATQIFATLTIIGIFVLFRLLSRLFFKKLPYSVYLALSVAFSVMSIWYSIAEPALYCTAITSAIALEVWSLYFFIRAVWDEKRENRQILLAGIGALLGALTFGCRPSIALANLLVIPILIIFLKQRKFTLKLLGKLALAALPYLLVAIALMLYNYARFDDPFEFGQAYQLTVADQTQYRITLDGDMLLRIVNGTAENLFERSTLQATFPYLQTKGVFFNFPILLLCFGIFRFSVLKDLRRSGLLPLMITLFLTVLIITAIDIMWTPYLLERYRMDIYFLMGIACFMVIGLQHNLCTERQRTYVSAGTVALAAVTVVMAFLLCVRTVDTYYPEKVSEIATALHLI